MSKCAIDTCKARPCLQTIGLESEVREPGYDRIILTQLQYEPAHDAP